MEKDVKAIGLISGGLDSTIATKMLQDQGVQITGINFSTGFCLTDHHRMIHRKNTTEKKIRHEALRAGSDLNFPIKIIDISKTYFRDVVLNPKYGYGSGMNPCLDCRLYMLKKAKRLMKKMDADFVFTGEVLGQRPMSQYRKALELLEKKSGLKDRLLRPLCAKHLDPTLPEKKGWIERDKLGAIEGRSRKKQIELAQDLSIDDFPQPAGGCCSLPDKNFSIKLKDYLTHQKRIYKKDLMLLKVGRHFRLSAQTKLIVGRDEAENKFLDNLKKGKWLLYVSDIPGPTALVNAKASKNELALSAGIVARYGDHNNGLTVRIHILKGTLKKTLSVKPLPTNEIDSYRIIQ